MEICASYVCSRIFKLLSMHFDNHNCWDRSLFDHRELLLLCLVSQDDKVIVGELLLFYVTSAIEWLLNNVVVSIVEKSNQRPDPSIATNLGRQRRYHHYFEPCYKCVVSKFGLYLINLIMTIQYLKLNYVIIKFQDLHHNRWQLVNKIGG